MSLREETEELTGKLADIASRYPIEVVPFISITHLIAAARSVNIPKNRIRVGLRQGLMEVPTPRSPEDVEEWPKGHLQDSNDFELYGHMFDSDVNHLFAAELPDVNAVLNALITLIISLVFAGVRKDYILNTFDEEWEHHQGGETVRIDPRRKQRPGGDFNGVRSQRSSRR